MSLFGRLFSTSRTALGSTMSQPQWVYKIFPSASVDARFAFPIPIPASHEFTLGPVDLHDGYVHLSTAAQVPGVLSRYFGDVPAVAIIRLDYGRLSAFKRVVWEKASDGQEYPHLYAHLEGENTDSFREVESGPKGWDGALQGIQDWLV